MFRIHNLFKSPISAICRAYEESPVVTTVSAVCAAAAIGASARYLYNKSQKGIPNRGKTTVSLVDGYEFGLNNAPKIVICPNNTMNGISALRSVILEAHKKGQSYSKCPELVAKLGQLCEPRP